MRPDEAELRTWSLSPGADIGRGSWISPSRWASSASLSRVGAGTRNESNGGGDRLDRQFRCPHGTSSRVRLDLPLCFRGAGATRGAGARRAIACVGMLGAAVELDPGQASTRHRHANQAELYVLLGGTGRVRVDVDLLTLEALSSVLVDPDAVRQVFNDTDADTLWLVVGAPPEAANTLEMTEEQLRFLYPDGPTALPPELAP